MVSRQDYEQACCHIMMEAELQVELIMRSKNSERPLDRAEIIEGARDMINPECRDGTLKKYLDLFGRRECEDNLYLWIRKMSAELRRRLSQFGEN